MVLVLNGCAVQLLVLNGCAVQYCVHVVVLKDDGIV
jgi:hypothetical protein